MSRLTQRFGRLVWGAILVALSLGANRSATQESIRTVDGPGAFTKFLTPGMVDRWIFKGLQDETIIARLDTNEFDSVIQLVQTVDATERVLLKIDDDDGSNCWLSFRLPADGEYKICVGGFEGKGGGNYSLTLQQFRAEPIDFGKTSVGTYDGKGRAYYRIQADPDQYLTVDVNSYSPNHWTVLDPQGKPIGAWNQLVALERGGEYVIALDGQAGHRFELNIRPAQRPPWQDGQESTGKLQPREAAVFDIAGKAGEFRVIELEGDGDLSSQLIFALPKADKEKRLDSNKDRPEIVLLPIGSKGDFTRYAVIFGRDARYQLQLFSQRGASFQSIATDCATIQSNQSVNEALAVGNTKFVKVDLQQGQTVTAQITSTDFDPILQLFDSYGREVRADDDGGEGLNCRLQYTAYAQETLLAAVASVGNGGGGNFDLSFKTEDANRMELNQKYTRQVGAGATEQWLFDGKQGQTVIFQLNHRNSSPQAVLRNSSGVELFKATATPQAKGVVFAYEFPSDSTYSLWITIPARGEYILRTSDADQ